MAGIRTPQPITEEAARTRSDKPRSKRSMPEVFAEFSGVCETLEKHYRDMQDMEFTVQRRQALHAADAATASAPRRAALKIAVDMAQRRADRRGGGGDAASTRLRSTSCCTRRSTRRPSARCSRTGLPASPGAASRRDRVHRRRGREARSRTGEAVILVRIETSPEDIHGMHAAEGILTTRGGMTSHAAVVARGMGKPCVAGAGALRVDLRRADDDGGRRRRCEEGDMHHHRRRRPARSSPALVPMVAAGAVGRVRDADGMGGRRAPHEGARQRRHAARRRARRASSAPRASACAAPSTCSSTGERIGAVREMILADDEEGRRAALAKLLPMQREDFVELFEIMAGCR